MEKKSGGRTNGSAQFETVVLVLIVVVVGIAAGAASFTHVHDWTMRHAPAGTADWFGWANACISDLLPVAAYLEIRRRRGSGRTHILPTIVMYGGMSLSLAAQLAVANPSLSSWILCAVPSLAFIGLTKMVLPASKTQAKASVSAPSTARRNVERVVPTAKAAEANKTTGEQTIDTAPVPPRKSVPPKRPTPHVVDGKKPRRSKEENQRLLLELMTTEPELTRKEQAQRLGVTDRYVRILLNELAAAGGGSLVPSSA